MTHKTSLARLSEPYLKNASNTIYIYIFLFSFCAECCSWERIRWLFAGGQVAVAATIVLGAFYSLCSCWPWGCQIWKVVPQPPVMNVWAPLMQRGNETTWVTNKTISSLLSVHIWTGRLYKNVRLKRNGRILLRRSGWSLVVGIHTEAAVAPHSRALEHRKGRGGEWGTTLVFKKRANRQGQRAGPGADALH